MTRRGRGGATSIQARWWAPPRRPTVKSHCRRRGRRAQGVQGGGGEASLRASTTSGWGRHHMLNHPPTVRRHNAGPAPSRREVFAAHAPALSAAEVTRNDVHARRGGGGVGGGGRMPATANPATAASPATPPAAAPTTTPAVHAAPPASLQTATHAWGGGRRATAPARMAQALTAAAPVGSQAGPLPPPEPAWRGLPLLATGAATDE